MAPGAHKVVWGSAPAPPDRSSGALARGSEAEVLRARLQAFHPLTSAQLRRLPELPSARAVGHTPELTAPDAELLRSFLASFQPQRIELGHRHPDPAVHPPNCGGEWVYVAEGSAKDVAACAPPTSRAAAASLHIGGVQKTSVELEGRGLLEVFSAAGIDSKVLCRMSKASGRPLATSPAAASPASAIDGLLNFGAVYSADRRGASSERAAGDNAALLPFASGGRPDSMQPRKVSPPRANRSPSPPRSPREWSGGGHFSRLVSQVESAAGAPPRSLFSHATADGTRSLRMPGAKASPASLSFLGARATPSRSSAAALPPPASPPRFHDPSPHLRDPSPRSDGASNPPGSAAPASAGLFQTDWNAFFAARMGAAPAPEPPALAVGPPSPPKSMLSVQQLTTTLPQGVVVGGVAPPMELSGSPEEDQAATRLQACFRGHKTRKGSPQRRSAGASSPSAAGTEQPAAPVSGAAGPWDGGHPERRPAQQHGSVATPPPAPRGRRKPLPEGPFKPSTLNPGIPRLSDRPPGSVRREPPRVRCSATPPASASSRPAARKPSPRRRADRQARVSEPAAARKVPTPKLSRKSSPATSLLNPASATPESGPWDRPGGMRVGQGSAPVRFASSLESGALLSEAEKAIELDDVREVVKDHADYRFSTVPVDPLLESAGKEARSALGPSFGAQTAPMDPADAAEMLREVRSKDSTASTKT